ncbi:MerR family transcriptional regulator [Paenibacillus sp. CAU 1782]
MTARGLMTRGQLARRSGVSAATIRFYEDSGVLPPPKRGENGYRLYGEDYLIKLKFITYTRALGYRLKEIKEILDQLSRAESGVDLRRLVAERMRAIEEHIALLQNMHAMLGQLLSTDEEMVQAYIASFRPRDSSSIH